LKHFGSLEFVRTKFCIKPVSAERWIEILIRALR
jgi:hypothetical protein